MIGTIKTYVSRWKKTRPSGFSFSLKHASSFLHLYILLFVSLLLLYSMILVKVHFKSTKSLVSFYAPAFLLSTARLLLINFLSDIIYRYLGFHRMQSLHRGEDFACNCVCHLSQVNGIYASRMCFNVFK